MEGLDRPNGEWRPKVQLASTAAPTPLPPQPSPLLLLRPHHVTPPSSCSASLPCPSSGQASSATSPPQPPRLSAPSDGPLRPHYAAVFIDASRHRLLHRVPPCHSTVYAHHMTIAYRPSAEDCLRLPLGAEAALFVVGSAEDDRAQAVEVTPPTWLPWLGDSVPHVTVSVAPGVSASEAGDLIRRARKKGEGGVRPVPALKLLHGIVGVYLTDGTIVHSAAELSRTLSSSQEAQSGGSTEQQQQVEGAAQLEQRAAKTEQRRRRRQQQQQEQRQGDEDDEDASSAEVAEDFVGGGKGAALAALMDELHAMHLRQRAAELLSGQGQSEVPIASSHARASQHSARGRGGQEHHIEPAAAAADADEGCSPASPQLLDAPGAQHPTPGPIDLAAIYRSCIAMPPPACLPSLSSANAARRMVGVPGRGTGGVEEDLGGLAGSWGLCATAATWRAAGENTEDGIDLNAAAPEREQQLGQLSRRFPLHDFRVLDAALTMYGDDCTAAVCFMSTLSTTAHRPARCSESPSGTAAPATPAQSSPRASTTAAVRSGGATISDGLPGRSAGKKKQQQPAQRWSTPGARPVPALPAMAAAVVPLAAVPGARPVPALPAMAAAAVPLAAVPLPASRLRGWATGIEPDLDPEAERTTAAMHQAVGRMFARAAQAAAAGGDAAAARAHRAAARDHAAAAVAARRRASASSYHLHNAPVLNVFRVDFHGMHVEEALAVLDRTAGHLLALRHPGGVLLQVVTGMGRHSRGGVPVLLPAGAAWLSERALLFDVEEANPGVVRVLLE